jgi:hypothetical protein
LQVQAEAIKLTAAQVAAVVVVAVEVMERPEQLTQVAAVVVVDNKAALYLTAQRAALEL